MPRSFSPKVVTANHLLDGDVVYMDGSGGWTRRLSEAQLFAAQAEAERALARAEAQSTAVVGAYLADAARGHGGPEPTHFRENFRRTGPSNYAHGKQADLAHV